MYCTNCGTKNEDDAKYCRNCGYKLYNGDKEVVGEENKGSEKVESTISVEEKEVLSKTISEEVKSKIGSEVSIENGNGELPKEETSPVVEEEASITISLGKQKLKKNKRGKIAVVLTVVAAVSFVVAVALGGTYLVKRFKSDAGVGVEEKANYNTLAHTEGYTNVNESVTDNPATTKPPVPSSEWRKAFEKEMKEVIEEIKLWDMEIWSAYVCDADGDNVPEVYVGGGRLYLSAFPDIAFTYKGGKIVKIPYELEDYWGSGAGSDFIFVKGTNYIIHRVYGSTTGTCSIHDAYVYLLEDDGYKFVKDVSNEEIKFNYQGDYEDHDAIGKYADELSKKIDAELLKIVKSDDWISYEKVEETEDPIKYLNEKLGISL